MNTDLRILKQRQPRVTQSTLLYCYLLVLKFICGISSKLKSAIGNWQSPIGTAGRRPPSDIECG